MIGSSLLRMTAALAMTGAVLLGGCVQDNIAPEQRGEATSGAAVQWPALRALDDLAHRVDHVIEDGEPEALAEIAGRLRETAMQVATDAVPAGARNPAQVRVLQADLRSLAESLADAEALGGEALVPAMSAFGSITHRLMQEASLPHAHTAATAAEGEPLTLADLGELEGPLHFGGTLLEFVPDHSVHGELVLDPESGTLRVYALDGNEEPTSFDDPLSAELIFDGWTSEGRKVRVALYPDASGLAYEYFEGFDENLKGAKWIAGRITGKFRGGGEMRNVDTEAGWPAGLEDDDHDGHEH